MHDEDFRNELPDDLRILWDQLDSIPDETANSPAMKIRFNAMLDAYQQKMDRSPRWWPLQPAIQVVIAILLLAAGLTIAAPIASAAAARRACPA